MCDSLDCAALFQLFKEFEELDCVAFPQSKHLGPFILLIGIHLIEPILDVFPAPEPLKFPSEPSNPDFGFILGYCFL